MLKMKTLILTVIVIFITGCTKQVPLCEDKYQYNNTFVDSYKKHKECLKWVKL